MVSVLTLAILFVVGSLGWMVRDRTAREQEIARDRVARQLVIKEQVEMALEDARKRHQEGRWREALDAAKRAEALVATGGSDAETYRRAREVLGDMQMLAKLEDVRADSTKNEAGFDLKEEDSGTAGPSGNMALISMRWIATWRQCASRIGRFASSWPCSSTVGPMSGGAWKHRVPFAPARTGGNCSKSHAWPIPIPARDRFRKAVLSDDRQALVQLAASAPISSLPAETVDRLGGALMASGAFEEAAVFLKKGQRVHPQEYWINANLGICLSQLGPAAPRRRHSLLYGGACAAS